MALVVLPEGVQISGSIGGTVWSHNRYGAYKRNRSVPVNPNTDRQVQIRNFIKALTIAWQLTLTQDQRDAWDLYAANVSWKNSLGQDVHLTGLNHYVRSNVAVLRCALTRIDDAPGIFDLAAAELALAGTASEATQTVDTSFDNTQAWANETGGFQQFAMGIPQNAAINFFGGPWRILGCTLGDDTTPPVSPVQHPAQWPIAEGQRIWIHSRIGRADGRLSEFARVNFLCAA